MNKSNNWTRREMMTGIGALAGVWALSERNFSRPALAQDTALKTEKLGEGLNIVTGAGGNIAVLTGPDGTLVVDTGLKPQADAVVTAVKGVSSAPVQMVVNTHWHFDHTGGNEAFGGTGAQIVAHTNTRKRLNSNQVVEFLDVKSAPSPRIALPAVVFDQNLTMFWGAEEIDMVHLAPAHTDSDIVLHFKNANVLHAGDLLFNGLYPFIDYSSGGWIGGMVAGADKILAMTDAKTKIIPGHGPMAGREDMKRFRDMLATIQGRVEKMVKAGKSVDEVIAAKPTADFDAAWGMGFLPPDKFARLVYLTLIKHKKA